MPETDKFFLKIFLNVHKQKLTQKCQNSSKNLIFFCTIFAFMVENLIKVKFDGFWET